ncbi:aminomethyltransferase, mitochondrial [Ischnura elegans]|uniref:aminomethyltransferase, mitochondrial n=1 Tax=Ischnura elegans TaxID=197161 RepID=UPI001ED86F22|nr:aminomethyltransferase, mitochondrial [Ischnura elegans]
MTFGATKIMMTYPALARWVSKQGHLIIRSASNAASSKKTCLHDFHVEHGGKMVDFAGYLLPVQYGSHGIAASHVHTRTCCSLFDVSHMAQTKIYGKDRVSFIESLTTADIQGLGLNQAQLSVLTNNSGGIIDDLIITNTSGTYLFIVSNASRREAVKNLFDETLGKTRGKLDVNVEMAGDDRALLALQGPESPRVLGPLMDVEVSKLTFMTSTEAKVAGVPGCRVSRLGYTGEDGVEISAPAEGARVIAEALLASRNGNVKLAGLGARDSLRLEAGLCLYGNDMDESTTPVEASLAWLVRKRRREEQGFPGAGIIVSQIKGGVPRKRVGVKSEGPPARHGTEVLGNEGEKIGHVTSGCPSPTLGCNVAMAYVKSEYAKVGTKLTLMVRKKPVEATVVKMPFVPHNYNK